MRLHICNTLNTKRSTTDNRYAKALCSALALGLLSSTSVPAGMNSTMLQNGAECQVVVDSPVTGTQYFVPPGSTEMDIAASGSAFVGAGNPLYSSYIYAMDLSGTTGTGYGTGCAPILDCEQKFVKALNDEIINLNVSNEVGMVVYGTGAAIVDLSPELGQQMLVTPDAGPGNLDTAVNSTGVGSIQQFTYHPVGPATNCQAALEQALVIVNAANNNSKIVVFVSDGLCMAGSRSGFDAAVNHLAGAGAAVHSIAVGINSSCMSTPSLTSAYGNLALMAAGTGGTCTEIVDPGNLPAIIPNLVASSLDMLEIEVDGSGAMMIPNNNIDPDLPQAPGPAGVNYNTPPISLGVGVHNICVTASCSDPLGVGSATQCETIEVIDQRPPEASDDSYSTDEDVPLAISAPGVLGNDTDPNNDALTVLSNTSPAHGSLNQNADGSFSYTPELNFCGTDSYSYTVSDGIDSDTATVVLDVACVNDPPKASDDTYNATEDTPLAVNAPGVLSNDSDPDGDALTVVSNTSPAHGSLNQNADGSFSYAPELNFCGTDSYSYTVSDGVLDGTANVVLDVACVNDPPVLGTISAPADPLPAGSQVDAQADFSDVDTGDTFTAVWDWGDGSTSSLNLTDAGAVSGSHVYNTAGVYTVSLTVTDAAGGSANAFYQYVVIYDTSAGFVTGNGQIDSPAGAYVLEPNASGRAQFGFVSKYQRGMTVPEGNTRFQFRTAKLDFQSTAYQWMVISGARVQFKGDGELNGVGGYGFLLTAIDGVLPGGGGDDKFRIKVWNKATGDAVYDNQMGATDDAEPATVILNGQIKLQQQ